MKREHLWEHFELDACQNWKLKEGGYASRTSVKQGEEINFHISNSRSYYDIHIFREGYQRKFIQSVDHLIGKLQDVPEDGYEKGFQWDVSCSLKIPMNWKSGIYFATFPTGQGIREIFFIVKPKSQNAPLLLTIPTNTYQAYNNVGGKSYYDYISTDRQHAKTLSFDRPYQKDGPIGYYNWDHFFVSWLDAQNYDVDFCCNEDHDLDPKLLEGYRATLRIGHDEYNSRNECFQLQNFVKEGGNLLLFGGNCFFWEIEHRDGGKMYCWKPHYHDVPTKEHPETNLLMFNEQLRQKTVGLYYTTFIHTKTDQPGVFLAPTSEDWGYYRVTDKDHWIFQGTNLKNGDEFGREDSVVGVEADGAHLEFIDGKPFLTGTDGVSKHYKILALADCLIDPESSIAPLTNCDKDGNSYGTLAINESEFNGTIVSAATIEWGHGLYKDPENTLSKITKNIFDRLVYSS